MSNHHNRRQFNFQLHGELAKFDEAAILKHVLSHCRLASKEASYGNCVLARAHADAAAEGVSELWRRGSQLSLLSS